jgi:transcription antitermination factor NusG
LESNQHHWYAFSVRAKRELFVADEFSQLGLEPYVPTFTAVRKYSDRLKEVQQPLFPGYVFGKLDIRQRLPVLQLSNVQGVVGPWAIPDEEIEGLRRGLASLTPWQPWPFLEPGQMVTVIAGPLQGMRGQIQELKGACQLVIGITLLQRAIGLEIDRNWIRPDEPDGGSLRRASRSQAAPRRCDERWKRQQEQQNWLLSSWVFSNEAN